MTVSPYLERPLRELSEVRPSFDCTKALELISAPCNTETDAQLRIAAVLPLIELAKALIEQAHGASVIRRDALDECQMLASNLIDELPSISAWEEAERIDQLCGEAA